MWSWSSLSGSGTREGLYPASKAWDDRSAASLPQRPPSPARRSPSPDELPNLVTRGVPGRSWRDGQLPSGETNSGERKSNLDSFIDAVLIGLPKTQEWPELAQLVEKHKKDMEAWALIVAERKAQEQARAAKKAAIEAARAAYREQERLKKLAEREAVIRRATAQRELQAEAERSKWERGTSSFRTAVRSGGCFTDYPIGSSLTQYEPPPPPPREGKRAGRGQRSQRP